MELMKLQYQILKLKIKINEKKRAKEIEVKIDEQARKDATRDNLNKQ